ncbi:SIS domain-containing protein [Bifidobacterium sp. CP2]|uniref:SIS domain-containing protein n=1 Tax=Bifidobacterium sp. CP2 TaxID=2809025 RepID=UPI001BDC2C4E|nr:SIS domain-containing protein [Bifidobacterium sp. CP2]MBT1182286.1 SIS domain-containing protein [Bifidobacterium sp. CP2]
MDTISGPQLLDIARNAAEIEGKAVLEVVGQIDESMLATIDMIERSTGKVFVTGAGTSGTIAHRFAHLLSVSGTPAIYLHAMDALHGSMGAIEPNDVIITISKGGESDEVNQLCRLLKEKGVGVIGIGEHAESTFAGIVDIFVLLHTIDGADPYNKLAMGSTLVAEAWGDALARALMVVHGWDEESSLKLHPAGAVGKYAKEHHVF